MNLKKIAIPFICLGLCLAIHSADRELNRMLEKGKFEKAEAYCLKQKGEKQRECLKALADAYLDKGDFQKAAGFYDKSGEKAREDGFKRIVEAYAAKNELDAALELYKSLPHCSGKALLFGKLGDYYKEKGDPVQAKHFYREAVDEYELLLKSLLYIWEPSYYSERRKYINALNSFDRPIEELLQLKRRSEILQRAADYCVKLKSASIYFYCREDIVETIDYGLDVGEGSRFIIGEAAAISDMKRKGPVKTALLYEYQLIQEEDKLEETRKLLKLNNMPARMADESGLLTRSFKFKEIIFGPVGLLSEYWQGHTDYKILREDVLYGENVVVIECLPKNQRDINLYFGNVWIKPEDGSVLKIEWNPRTLGISDFVRAMVKNTRTTPVITFFTEYANEKNGIRFPSRSFLKESYIDEKGKERVLVELDVRYIDYKYFSVGTEIVDVE